MLADPTAFGSDLRALSRDLHTFDETGGCPLVRKQRVGGGEKEGGEGGGSQTEA